MYEAEIQSHSLAKEQIIKAYNCSKWLVMLSSMRFCVYANEPYGFLKQCEFDD
jgi:hypothetical protein